MQNIIQISSASPRVCYVIFKLNLRYNIEIIQAYASTCQHSYQSKDIESFYDDVAQAMSTYPADFTLLAGDFNAKLGKKQNERETSLGFYAIGERNEREN